MNSYGEVTSSTLMGTKPSCLVPTRTGWMIADNNGVSVFLSKLYLMVDDEATNSIISWGSSRTSFIISDEPRFSLKILPSYFKMGHFDTFITQLNNYGFKKKVCNRLEFEHENFQEGKLHLLKTIKSKKQVRSVTKKLSCDRINKLKTTFDKVRHRQKQIDNKTGRLQNDMEQTLSGIQTKTEAMINKLVSTFSESIRRKRTFLDTNERISFVDIEKNLESINHHFEGSMSDIDKCLMKLSVLKEKTTTGYDGEGNMYGKVVPKFLQELYNMVEKEETNDLISWNLPFGDSFIISDINKFASDILPTCFIHKNYASFHSQLNLYGFKKVRRDKEEYQNAWFRRGKYELLVNIKTRITSPQVTTLSTTEVKMLSNQLKAMQRDLENKVILQSNYEQQMKSLVNEFKESVVNMANVVDKMIPKVTERLGNVKTVQSGSKKDVIGNEEGQEWEVNEVETTSLDLEAQSYSQELGMDLEALERIWMEGDLPEIHGLDDMILHIHIMADN